MNRREFLAATAGAALSGSLPASTGHKRAELLPMMHGTWTGGGLDYAAMNGHGLTHIFYGGSDPDEVKRIVDAGLQAHLWMWTTNRRDAWIMENHPEWYMVSQTGQSCHDEPPYVDYYRWVTPHNPAVINYLVEKVGELAQIEGVTGIHLDYVRYPDVILPRALWETYDLDQTEELPRYDFDYSPTARTAFKESHGRDPMEIEHPDRDQEWIAFRQAAIVHLVGKLRAEASAHGKQMSAAVFPTPQMARVICRQAWDEFDLDFATPMIYHSFYNETPEWIGDKVRENIRMVEFPVVAGLYRPGFADTAELRQGIQWALKRGAKGISMFGNLSDEDWAAFREETEGFG